MTEKRRTEDLVQKLRSGDPRSLAKCISIIENNDPVAQDLLNSLFGLAGRAIRLGITGPPGAGKSTLTSKLSLLYAEAGKKVGILAIDPSSPFSGGAVLGDRIRMSEVALHPNVFIRSMATRGSLGGLAEAAQDVSVLFDAFGMDLIIYETVGVGQGELDVVNAADTTIVVLVPESGDGIQAMKAGLMEIADIFVVNKADREGANRLKLELESILQLKPEKSAWQAPILSTVAKDNKGISELKDEIAEHQKHLLESGKLKENRLLRVKRKLELVVLKELADNFWSPDRREALQSVANKIIEGKMTPLEAISFIKNSK
ncbi:MAG: methylmalonyl Co-A mutase-associated GTPase MeaB [Calditrichia bacterium]